MSEQIDQGRAGIFNVQVDVAAVEGLGHDVGSAQEGLGFDFQFCIAFQHVFHHVNQDVLFGEVFAADSHLVLFFFRRSAAAGQ